MPTQLEKTLGSEAARAWSLERRANERRPARSSVLIEVHKGRRRLGPNLAVHLLDLSEAGAGVFMKGALQQNDEVEVRLSVSGVRSSIKRIARVRWVTKLETGYFLMGLQFERPIPSADVSNYVRPN